MPKFKISDAHQFEVGAGFELSETSTNPADYWDGDEKDLDNEFHRFDKEISKLEERLFANGISNRESAPSLLIVLQGMDTSGKDGMVKAILNLMMPQGSESVAFERPTEEEAAHDFLWRVANKAPKPGHVTVFDRSHYEDVLIQRVDNMADPEEIERRYGAIVEFEAHLAQRGVRIIKVMLNISKDFQKHNLLERLNNPKKYWKYDPSDLHARSQWDKYMEAYQIALERTSTPIAPWYCIPGDNKKFARMVVKHLVVEALRDITGPYPSVNFDVAAEIEKVERS